MKYGSNYSQEKEHIEAKKPRNKVKGSLNWLNYTIKACLPGCLEIKGTEKGSVLLFIFGTKSILGLLYIWNDYYKWKQLMKMSRSVEL